MRRPMSAPRQSELVLPPESFEVLAAAETHPTSRVRVELVRSMAQAVGAAGMVGGQMLDLLAENIPMDIGAITRLQRMKTGAMIAFYCE